ncbi:MAG TPA: hypothetical protein VFA29_05525 [Candidatus Baltobacteraceae bacterium]|nr:hypothetical protein [Candidatus Baltobacteraceae bacterium]
MKRYGLALGAATAFAVVAVIDIAVWFSTHKPYNAILAGLFAALALLWFAVSLKYKREA